MKTWVQEQNAFEVFIAATTRHAQLSARGIRASICSSIWILLSQQSEDVVVQDSQCRPAEEWQISVVVTSVLRMNYICKLTRWETQPSKSSEVVVEEEVQHERHEPVLIAKETAWIPHKDTLNKIAND